MPKAIQAGVQGLGFSDLVLYHTVQDQGLKLINEP